MPGPPISHLAPQLLHTSNTVFEKFGPTFWILALPAAKSWQRAWLNTVRIITLSRRDANNIMEYRLASFTSSCYFPVREVMFRFAFTLLRED